MLAQSAVWVFAILMATGMAAGAIAFTRRGVHVAGGHHPGFRAQDNPPRAAQVAWLIVVFVPPAYPFVVVLAPSLAYGTVLHFAFPFDATAQVAGFLLWGIGGMLVVWSGRTLGRFMVAEIAVSVDHELVTTGPYARVRHPTYTGAIALSFGATLLFLSWVLLAVTVLVVVLANYRAGKEERLLASGAGFGERYRAYVARTGRFLPRVVR